MLLHGIASKEEPVDRGAVMKPPDRPAVSDHSADNVLPAFYDELRSLAARYLKNERADHTLQPTALVHEAYLRLVEQRNVRWEDRVQFFAAAAAAIRRVLVNHAIARRTLKRGGLYCKQVIEADEIIPEGPSVDLVALDEALTQLAELDQRQSKIVELRFFGGLGVDETAEVLGISPRSVRRDWRLAKAWLHQEISKGGSE